MVPNLVIRPHPGPSPEGGGAGVRLFPFSLAMFVQQKIKNTGFVTVLLCCGAFSISFAQSPSALNTFTGTIKGVIIDSALHEVVSNVSVMVFETGRKQFIKGAMSKENGSFKLKGLPLKQYTLTFSCIGYKTKTIQLPLFASAIIDLHNILLVPAALQLKEVQVTTKKQLIGYDIDKIIYNVDEDPEKEMLSALEMLRKVPLLSVNADDDLLVNGNSNYQILLNGNTSSLFVNNAPDVLKAMRASTIKTVEVITNPPSRYDAEGTGGIINIITYKKNITGYAGAVNVAVESPNAYTLSNYLTGGIGKWGFSCQFASNAQKNPTGSNSFFRYDKLRYNQLQQNGETSNKNSFRYMNGEASYRVSGYDLIIINYNVNGSSGTNIFKQQVQLLDSAHKLNAAYFRLNSGENNGNGFDVGMKYQHNFKRNDKQLLMVSYKLTNNSNNSNADFVMVPLLNYYGEVSKTNNNEGNREHSLQIDYVQPIKQHTFELGIKSRYSLNKSNYFYKNKVPGDSFVLDQGLTNNFNYRQHIQAVYSSIYFKKGAWGLRIGARIEQTKVEANFKSVQASVVQNYFNFIPNINLFCKLTGSNMMRLTYTQRIERPGLYYLNPYVNVADPRNISFGNPQLKPAIVHVFSLSYNTVIRKSYFSVTLLHNYTNNSIQQYTTLRTDTIATTTFGNIGKHQTTGLALTGNTIFLKRLSVNVNSNMSYIQFTSMIKGNRQNNKGLTFSLFGSVGYRFNKGWRINGDAGFNTRGLSVQGRTGGFIKNSISANKQFLKNNKAGISLLVNSPFQKRRYSFNEVNDPSFYQLQQSWSLMRRFVISFNYSFGKIGSKRAP